MASRTPLAAAAALGAAVIVTTVAMRFSGANSPATASTVPTGVAAVVRTTITSRQQVNGTLGYGTPSTIAAPSGATPDQVRAAQSAYDAAAVQLRNARGQSVDETGIANAQAALDAAVAAYAAAKNTSMTLLDNAYADTQTFRGGIDDAFGALDAALNEPPESGSDWHSAMTTLNSALTPITNARTSAAADLMAALGTYQRAHNDLGVAIAHFDAAFAASADTGASAAELSTALTGHDLAAARLSGAIDLVNGPLAQAATAVTTAQSLLNSPTSRYNIRYDALRVDLTRLLKAVTDEQQLATATKIKIDRAGTTLATVQTAIHGGLVASRQSVAAATSQASQSRTQSGATIATAQQQLNGASAQLATARAGEVLGAGTLTWLPELGAIIGRGQPLYAVNGRPVPLLTGVIPMYRRLALGATGDDVAELEENLRALGFAASAGGTFNSADADALRTWQRSLGVDETGDLPLGSVVVMPGSVRVSGLHAAVASPYVPGQPLLDMTDIAHIVTVALDATLQSSVKVGDAVTVQLPGSSRSFTGKVSLLSPVAQSASSGNQQQGPLRATVNLTVALDDPAAGGSIDQAPVRVSIVDKVRTNVLAVPVTSLVARADGTFIVRVIHGAQRDDVVVVPGVFGDNGLVEVTATGLSAGDQVEVPKPL